jgi:hypothetical protein
MLLVFVCCRHCYRYALVLTLVSAVVLTVVDMYTCVMSARLSALGP